MKKFLLIALAATTLVGCSNEDVIMQQEGELISFGQAFVDNATRAAADPSYSANHITSFKVYGTVNAGKGEALIYPGTPVTKDTAGYGDAWTCNVSQYWVPGAAYQFIGIVDGDKSGVSSTTLGTNGMPTSVSYTADGVTDLLCQTVEATGKVSGNSIVGFNFTHLLAKAKFTVTNNTPEATNYLHKVRNIVITNAYNKGVYDISNKTWGTLETTAGMAFDGITAKDATTECANEKLLIPQESVIVSFVVDLYYVDAEGETLIGTTEYTGNNAVNVNTKLEAANAYNFNITVAVGELIKFTVEQQPTWTSKPDVTVQ